MRISILKLLLLLLISINIAFSQNYNSTVDELIESVNLDSILSHVRILSGEDSVIIEGEKKLITNRTNLSDRILAGKFIQSKLDSYGIETFIQSFSFDTTFGNNVIGKQIGILSDSTIIICAHYDAVEESPGADDNSSGTAAVLETARLLSKYPVKYNVLYILWDLEEIGLIGSTYFCFSDSALNGIKYVLNVEMLGYDHNFDYAVDVHVQPVANSVEMAELFKSFSELYNLKPDIEIVNPGTDRSDHAVFWEKNISALAFSQDFMPDESNFTPYYHTPDDKIEYFNQDFFKENVKAAVAFMAGLSIDENTSAAEDNYVVKDFVLHQNYPNPFNPATKIKFSLPAQEFVTIKIYNVLGSEVKTLLNSYKAAGSHSIVFDAENLPSGIYLYKINAGRFSEIKKMMVVK